MRGSLLAVIFCSLFLFVGSTAYSATTHRVKGGETLQKIAKKHGTTAERLRSLNRLGSDALKPGQRLTVSRGEKMVSKKLAQRNRARQREIEVVEDREDPDFIEYRVRKGDTVDKLADKFGVDKQDIIDLNALKRTARLTPGTKLMIPRETADESPAAVSEPSFDLANARPLKPWKNEEEPSFLVKVARSFSGAPYKYGGDSVRGLDCSAFVRKMYEIFDVQLPRTAREQFMAGMRVDKENLVKGDLVFFRTKRCVKHPTHVGIYIGDGKFIHASSVLKRGVKIDSLSEGYFERTFTGAVRVKTLDRTSSELGDAAKPPASS